MYSSDFAGFTFIENCKVHNVPLVKYSWGDQCPLCIQRDYVFWEGTTDPFIHKDCVSPSIPQTAENVNGFILTTKSYAQLQPHNSIPARMKQVDDFARLISNETTLHRYDDVYQQLPREGYLLLSKKSGKIVATIEIKKDPNDVKQSFI